MEIAFLLLLFILEMALTVCVGMGGRDKEKWYRYRMFIRIIEVAAILLFPVLPGVHADFRFKFCSGLLLIRLVIAAIVWFRKRKKAEGAISIWGLTWRLLGSILLLTISMIPAFVFGNYEGLELTGEYGVKKAQAILVDNSRKETFEQDGSSREVPIYIYYPDAENGSFPLVLFSHGAFGYYQSNDSTYMELASNGYVVVSMDHPYHSFFTTDTAGNTIIVDQRFLGEVQKINLESTPEEESLGMSSKWLAIRTADMGFALDSLKHAAETGALTDEWHISGSAKNEEILHALSMINCDKIGVMGHSLGGAASVTLGRTRDDIDAVIDLDGTMLGEEIGYEDGHCLYIEEPYPVPLLSVDNEEHHNDADEAGLVYVNKYVLANAAEGYHTWFKGSGHMNFTDLPLFSPPLAAMLGTGSIDSESCVVQMNEIVLQFYNYYLKDMGELSIQECYE